MPASIPPVADGVIMRPDTPLAGQSLLYLAQWLSPAYPLGSFAWSQGLEQAVADGALRTRGDLRDWCDAWLAWGPGRTEAILLAAAIRGEDPRALSELALALAPSAERRAETLEQGTAFARTTAAIHGLDLGPAALPVAVGQAARAMDLPAEPALLLYLQAMLSALIQAAQRLMPLGQTEAQELLARLGEDLPGIAQPLLALGPDDIGGFAPWLDAASMRHERLEPRLFRS